MIEGPNGVMMGVPMHYTPAPPPPANDVSAAKTALQQHLGNNAPDDSAALAAAIKKIQEENAAISADALARAAILLQEQYDAAHHQPQDANVDPIKEAESQVGLTHQFDQGTLDAAAKSLMDSPLATAPASTPNTPNAAPSVSLADARTAIQTGLNNGLTWQEAVNAARVQFGGLGQNETVLDEAAITVKGDALVSGSDASGGNVLNDAAKQIAGLHLFADANNGAAVAALKVTLKPSAALANDAKQADSAWATLQQDQAEHASKLQLGMDLQNYHGALSKELDDAAGKTPSEATSAYGTANWANDPSQSDLRWQAEQALVAANTATSLTDAPSTSDLVTSLRATVIVDATQATRASEGPNSNAPANLKAAQFLTQQLAGLNPKDDLSRQVMGDLRTQALHDAALADITGAQGKDAQSTLIAEGQALSGYRNTVLFASLLHDTLGSDTTQHNLQAMGTPDNLRDISDLLDPLAKASPELAQALFTQLQGKIESLIGQGPQEVVSPESAQQMDAYYGPLARIIDDAGGPKSAATQLVMNALRTQLQKLQAQIDQANAHSSPGVMPPPNPFQQLAYLSNPQNNDPTTVYQSLIDEAPTSALAKSLEQFTQLKPQAAPATVSSPSDASALAQAQAALEKTLGNGPVNAQTLQKALDKAKADTAQANAKDNTSISDTTWAQAALVEQSQADGRANASNKTAPPQDTIAQASGELAGDQVFDANTLDAATRALQDGTLVDGSSTRGSVAVQEGVPSGSGTSSNPSATQYMQSLVSEGMTMPEAIVLTRAWLGGTSGSEPALVQAALTVRAELPAQAGQPSIMQQYYDDPTNPAKDPITLAAQALEALNKTVGGNANDPVNLLDPALIDQTANGVPASAGTPGTAGMAQDIEPNLDALNGKHGQPGLIDSVNSAYSAWQSAQAKAKANPNDSGAQSANTAALAKYQSALSQALNAAAGKPGGDVSWLGDPTNVDTVWKAEYELEQNALAPQAMAAQGTAQDSPENQALQSAFKQWQHGLDALQAISTGQLAQQQAAAGANGDASAGNVAAAQSLTFQLGGLDKTDPLYVQVMDSAWGSGIEKTALATITAAGAPPMMCLANGAEEPNAQARFKAQGTLLQQYQPTLIYAQLMTDVVNDPTTQQLFTTIEGQVNGHKSDADKLQALADVVQGSGSADLLARLVHQMFSTGGTKPGTKPSFSPAQLVAWTQDANDLTQVSRIYVAAGGAQNGDMTDLRHALETMVTSSDTSFGGESGSSQLNSHLSPMGRVVVRRGEDLGLGTVKSNHDPMQLAQDMLDDNATDPLGKEIARETGYKDAGKPAAGVSASAPGKAALSSDAAYVPGAGVSVSTGGSLVGLQLPDGMQTFSSYDALLNAVGSANDLAVAYTPSTLGDEQALSDGTFALYDPNEEVFDASGRKTTLGQVVQKLMQGEGVSTPSSLAPVTMAALSGEWWNTRTPSQGQPGTSFTLLEGISASGSLINVGPADPTVRQGYDDWQSHTGFAKGFLTVQPHWVVNAQGVDLTDAAYFTDYKPYQSWWERWSGDLGIGVMVLAGVAALFTPEAAPLWLALASEAADAYFAVTAAMGTVNAMQKLSTSQGRRNWVNWLDLAANVFGGAASGLGAFARAAAVGDRLAVGSSAYADVARVTHVAYGTDAATLADAQVEAMRSGMRASMVFKDTSLSRLLARPVVASAGTMRELDAFAQTMRAMQGSDLFKWLGWAAMGTNGVSMTQQGWSLIEAMREGKPVSAQDWLNLLTSAGMMAAGIGVGRMHAREQGAEYRGAVNRVLPQGVRLLDSGDVEINVEGLRNLDQASANDVALLTGRRQVADVLVVAGAMRNGGRLADLTDGGGGQGALTDAQLKALQKGLPVGIKLSDTGTLVLEALPKGGNAYALGSRNQIAALMLAILGSRPRTNAENGSATDSPDQASTRPDSIAVASPGSGVDMIAAPTPYDDSEQNRLGFAYSKHHNVISLFSASDPAIQLVVGMETDAEGNPLTDRAESIDILMINRGTLPPGSGSRLLVTLFDHYGIVPTANDRMTFQGIDNQPTLDAFGGGADPAQTPLGKSLTRALRAWGLEADGFEFASSMPGKVSLIAYLRDAGSTNRAAGSGEPPVDGDTQPPLGGLSLSADYHPAPAVVSDAQKWRQGLLDVANPMKSSALDGYLLPGTQSATRVLDPDALENALVDIGVSRDTARALTAALERTEPLGIPAVPAASFYKGNEAAAQVAASDAEIGLSAEDILAHRVYGAAARQFAAYLATEKRLNQKKASRANYSETLSGKMRAALETAAAHADNPEALWGGEFVSDRLRENAAKFLSNELTLYIDGGKGRLDKLEAQLPNLPEGMLGSPAFREAVRQAYEDKTGDPMLPSFDRTGEDVEATQASELPDTAAELVDPRTFQHDAIFSFSYLRGESEFRVASPKDSYRLRAQGTPESEVLGSDGAPLHPLQLVLGQTEPYDLMKRPVVLAADYAGRGGAQSYAQRLADTVGSEVIAPDCALQIEDGQAVATNGGNWFRFRPNARKPIGSVSFDAQTASRNEVIVTDTAGQRQTVPLEAALGPLLGHGAVKSVATLGTDKVAAFLDPDMGEFMIEAELDALRLFEERGAPVVSMYDERMECFGRTVVFYDRYLCSTKDLQRYGPNGERLIESDYFNETTIQDATQLRQVVQEVFSTLDDLPGDIEFALEKDGHLKLCDLEVGVFSRAPEGNQLERFNEFFDAIIAGANKAIASRASASGDPASTETPIDSEEPPGGRSLSAAYHPGPVHAPRSALPAAFRHTEPPPSTSLLESAVSDTGALAWSPAAQRAMSSIDPAALRDALVANGVADSTAQAIVAQLKRPPALPVGSVALRQLSSNDGASSIADSSASNLPSATAETIGQDGLGLTYRQSRSGNWLFLASEHDPGLSIKVSLDANAGDGAGVINVQEVNGGNLPSGSEGWLLMALLDHFGAIPESEAMLVFPDVIDPQTLAAFENGGDPAQTPLATSSSAALSAHGLTISRCEFDDHGNQLSLIAWLHRADSTEPSADDSPDEFSQSGRSVSPRREAWMQTVVDVRPAPDGRSVTLTDPHGRSMSASALGLRGSLPLRREDVLMPGDVPHGQPFKALLDPADGSIVIVRHIRGGAADSDPEKESADARREALANRALYAGTATSDDYRLLLASARNALSRISPEPLTRSEIIDVLRSHVDALLEQEADQLPRQAAAHRVQEGQMPDHDVAVRYVINRAILVARAAASAEGGFGKMPPIGLHRLALDLTVGLRTSSARNSRSLILRDADHYLSNLTQEWQFGLTRNSADRARNPSVLLARLSRPVAWTYDMSKMLGKRIGAKSDLPPDADVAAMEPAKIPASPPGGRGWAALGTRDFLRLSNSGAAHDDLSIVTDTPRRTEPSADDSPEAPSQSGLYVSRQVDAASARRMFELAAQRLADQGIDLPLVPADKMHVTVVRSPNALRDGETLTPQTEPIVLAPEDSGGTWQIVKLGNGIVLRCAAPALAARWEEARQKGAGWTYGDSYVVHITLAYGAADLPDFEPLTVDAFPITLLGEKHVPFDADWVSKNMPARSDGESGADAADETRGDSL